MAIDQCAGTPSAGAKASADMWPERLWSYLGPISVITVPFLLFAAQQGIPTGAWWDSAADPAVLVTLSLVVAAIVHGFLTLAQLPARERSVIERDVERFVRRAFGPLNAHLPDVPITRLGVHVWLTDGDRLERFVTYTVEQPRPRTPVSWGRGKRVIGFAWQKKQAIVADLGPVYSKANELGPAEFDALDPEDRWGLTAEEVGTGGRYKAVLAHPLTDEASQAVVGVLSVDCAVEVDPEALARLLDDRDFQDVLGSCESALRRYPGR